MLQKFYLHCQIQSNLFEYFLFSFVQDAIFLIGGLTKETKPEALMLHSGDICIMSGQSRLVYHAVPKVLSAGPDRIHRCVFSSTVVNNISKCDKYNNAFSQKSCDVQTEIKSCHQHSNINSYDQECKLCKQSFVSDDQSSQSCDNICVKCKSVNSLESREHAQNCDTYYMVEAISDTMSDEKFLCEYLKCTRININVRQVLKPNENFPMQEDLKNDCKKIKLDQEWSIILSVVFYLFWLVY